jgi:hypothetical protein
VEEYTFGQEWLEYIEAEIEKKYNLKNINFIIYDYKNAINSKEYLIQWMINKISFEKKWVKYRKIKDTTFELKDFFPDSSNKICNELVGKTLNFLEKKHWPNKVYYKHNKTFLDKKNMWPEVFWTIQKGYTRIFYDKQPNQDNKIVYQLSYSELDIHNLVENGFLKLEFK